MSVSSCTAGLHLSCIVSGFKKGDEVIIPAMTHTATAHAVNIPARKQYLQTLNFLQEIYL